jgi:two-component system chemotaxis response regulator CheY
MKILLIEDSKTLRSIARSVLGQLGYHHVEEARDGSEALAVAALGAPDLILVDCAMPVADGFSFVREFRRSDSTTPIIMMFTEQESFADARAAGAGVNASILKPFTPDQLRRRIEETLSIRQLRIAA